MTATAGSDETGDAAARAAWEEGMAAYTARDLPGAHAAFERAHRRDPRNPITMSWYGLTLVLVEKNSNLGMSLVDQALRLVGPTPELLLNAARIHLALNQRERAVRAVGRALELWPEDPRLLTARAAMGTRGSPVIPFLSRKNPLNNMLGRLRHRWARRNGPVYDLSPAWLGMPPAGGQGEPPRS